MSELARRCAAEGIGTALLTAAVIGSGIMGERLASGNLALALLANSVATGGALYALVLVLGPPSGAHFNPIITLAARADGALSGVRALGYVVAQSAGAAVGVATANLMFGLPAITLSDTARASPGHWLGEAVATFGLVLTVRGVATHGTRAVAAAVSAYLVGAYWFTSSTAFANPVVTLARAFSATFAGIRIGDVAGFVLAQAIGGAAGYLASRYLGIPATVEVSR